MELVEIKAANYGLEDKKGKELTSGLTQVLIERETLESQYAELIKEELTDELYPKAKELRLMIRNNRTKGIEAWHKVNKSFFLYGGKFVDAIKNKESDINSRMESKLLEIEQHQENLEKQKLQKLKEERFLELAKYGREDDPVQAELMSDDIWKNYISGVQLAYTKLKEDEAKEKAALIEAEKKARIEEIERQRIQEETRLENEKLKKEASDKAEAQRIIDLDREKKESDERAKAQKILDAERKSKEDAQAKLKAQEDAKLKAELDAEKKRQDELNASDTILRRMLVSDLEELKNKYKFKSEKNNKMYSDVKGLLDKVVAHIGK